ncbi:MAG: ATP-binding protein [Pseudomonadota bacterium]
MGVIFVAGVHAVGKTTACAYAADVLRIPHYAASSLIKAEKASAIPVHGKAVADVDGNQVLLIRGVHKACERHDGRIILDGHFTLSKPRGEIEAIALDVFRALELDGVVIFQDEPAVIAERLNLRDGGGGNPGAIALHQEAELAHAHSISVELSVPIKILSAFDSAGLVSTISDWISER